MSDLNVLNMGLTKPKYISGDIVFISNDLPKCMWHFRKGELAMIVDYSDSTKTVNYSLRYVKDGKYTSWYPEDLLLEVDLEDKAIKEIKKVFRREENECKS